MHIVLKILWLVIVSGLGGLAFALTANLLIMTGILDPATVPDGFGQALTSQAAVVWLVSIGVGALSLAVQSRWRYILLFAPIYAPALFAVIYVLTHGTGTPGITVE